MTRRDFTSVLFGTAGLAFVFLASPAMAGDFTEGLGDLRPDLTVDFESDAFCLPGELVGGRENNCVEYHYTDIIVTNIGPTGSSWVWLDLFEGLRQAPEMGDLSDMYFRVPALAAGESWEQRILTPVAPTWVDAIVDSTQRLDERSERNNIHSERLSW